MEEWSFLLTETQQKPKYMKRRQGNTKVMSRHNKLDSTKKKSSIQPGIYVYSIYTPYRMIYISFRRASTFFLPRPRLSTRHHIDNVQHGWCLFPLDTVETNSYPTRMQAFTDTKAVEWYIRCRSNLLRSTADTWLRRLTERVLTCRNLDKRKYTCTKRNSNRLDQGTEIEPRLTVLLSRCCVSFSPTSILRTLHHRAESFLIQPKRQHTFRPDPGNQ